MCSSITTNDSTRILAVKIAALLADLALREFPQRWQTFVSDLLSPVSKGGMWCEAGADVGANTSGVKMCLECFKLITEDCTDSDYNARVGDINWIHAFYSPQHLCMKLSFDMYSFIPFQRWEKVIL
jgi:hypothetical protein